jgi:hypothetical protein
MNTRSWFHPTRTGPTARLGERVEKRAATQTDVARMSGRRG